MKRSFLIALFLMLFAGVGMIMGDMYIDDGLSHTISNQINGTSYLDYNVANIPGTEIELIANGDIFFLKSYNHSSVINNGGTIFSVEAFDQSTLIINSGSIGWRAAVNDNSEMHIYGGDLGEWIDAYDSGKIYLYGSNFVINGVTLQSGDSLRDYAELDYWGDYYHDFISGVWNDGTPFFTGFNIERITDADIIVIPEPSALLLLSLGCLIYRNIYSNRR